MSNKSFNPNRVPGGVPAGGEFANKRTSEFSGELNLPVVSSSDVELEEHEAALDRWMSDNGVEVDISSTGESVDDSGWRHRGYHAVFTKDGAEPFEIRYRSGMGIDGPPHRAQVLASALQDVQSVEGFDRNVSGYKDFCQEFGYENDLDKGEEVWEECWRIRDGVKEFMGDDSEYYEFYEDY